MKSSVSYNKYIKVGACPRQDNYLIARYHVQRDPRSKLDGLSWLGSIAAEASTGTWIDVGNSSRTQKDVSGFCFAYNEEVGLADFAFPLDLFEPGNLSQLLTVVAGNSLGLADLARIRLLDITLPPALVESFSGSRFGIDGIRKILDLNQGRPMIGAIMKPKCGLSADDHASLCFESWVGKAGNGGLHGVDAVKDDEALTHQSAFGSAFYDRVEKTLAALKRAEDISGAPKMYIPNITHSNFAESLRRADFVRKHGGTAVMIDYVISGGALLHSVRSEDFGLVIHGHRTMFAAMHRSQDFGVDYMVWAKLFRIVGGDQVHTGTPGLGVMSSSVGTVSNVCAAMRQSQFEPTESYLPQDFGNRPAVLPICGAGLDPLTVGPLAEFLDGDVAIFAGGGCHGHPEGTAAGAASLRAGVEAYQQRQSLSQWARDHKFPEVNLALSFFGNFDKQSPNDAARENM